MVAHPHVSQDSGPKRNGAMLFVTSVQYVVNQANLQRTSLSASIGNLTQITAQLTLLPEAQKKNNHAGTLISYS